MVSDLSPSSVIQYFTYSLWINLLLSHRFIHNLLSILWKAQQVESYQNSFHIKNYMKADKKVIQEYFHP
jgi:hypothetical protein